MDQSAACVIVGAGECCAPRHTPAPGDYLIAADGGYAMLERYGWTADLVLGDFDSLEQPPAGDSVVTFPVEKDDTDMMLAVKQGMALGYRLFYLYGGVGGRLSHTLANIQTLTFLSDHGCRGFLLGDGLLMTVLRDGRAAFDPRCQGLLSVFSLSDTCDGVRLRGLKYPLEGVRLTSGFPLGVSNHFQGEPATVSVAEGTLLLVWEHESAHTDWVAFS